MQNFLYINIYTVCDNVFRMYVIKEDNAILCIVDFNIYNLTLFLSVLLYFVCIFYCYDN